MRLIEIETDRSEEIDREEIRTRKKERGKLCITDRVEKRKCKLTD